MVIALVAGKRQGKDTIANYLSNKMNYINYDYERYGFADPIRRMCKDVFLWNDDWIENHKEEIDTRWGLSYRQAAQVIGSELFQFDFGVHLPEFAKVTGRLLWIKRFMYIYESNPFVNYVISDCRFPHEGEMLKSIGAKFIHIKRDVPLSKDTHMSETQIYDLPMDYFIDNNGTYKELIKNVDIIMKDIKEHG